MEPVDSNQPNVAIVPNTGWDARVQAFRYGEIVDSFAVLTERYTILVDTMVNPESMSAVLRLLKASAVGPPGPLLVINTHGDWDHVWGNGLFAGSTARFPAPILGSRLAAQAMESARSRQFMLDYKSQHPGEYDTAEWVAPTITFDGAARLDGGDLSLELLPTPGHTPDHLAVWIPEIRLLLAGDAAEAAMPYVNGAETLPQLRATLRDLAALDPHTVLACHAPGNHSPDLLRWNLDYFDQLESRCRTHLGDAEELLATWSLETAVPVRWQPTAGQREFYRASHQRAMAAMLEWVRTEAAEPPDVSAGIR